MRAGGCRPPLACAGLTSKTNSMAAKTGVAMGSNSARRAKEAKVRAIWAMRTTTSWPTLAPAAWVVPPWTTKGPWGRVGVPVACPNAAVAAAAASHAGTALWLPERRGAAPRLHRCESHAAGAGGPIPVRRLFFSWPVLLPCRANAYFGIFSRLRGGPCWGHTLWEVTFLGSSTHYR